MSERCHTYLVNATPAASGVLYQPACLIHGPLTGGSFKRATAEKIADEHRRATGDDTYPEKENDR